MKVIVFPHISQIFGFPAEIRLTDAQAVAMQRVHLGGIEAICTPEYRTTSSNISSLVKMKLLDSHGPTELGKAVGKSLIESSICE